MTSISYYFNDTEGIKLPDEFLEDCLTEHAYCIQIPDEDGLRCLGVYMDISRIPDGEKRNAEKVCVIDGRLQVPSLFREKLNDCVVIVTFDNLFEI